MHYGFFGLADGYLHPSIDGAGHQHHSARAGAIDVCCQKYLATKKERCRPFFFTRHLAICLSKQIFKQRPFLTNNCPFHFATAFAQVEFSIKNNLAFASFWIPFRQAYFIITIQTKFSH